MKKLVAACLSVLIATVLLNYLPIHGEEGIYTDTIRLHVIAKSDSEKHQAEKLAVRDSVLELVGERLEGVTDFEAANEVLCGMTEEIKLCAEETLLDLGNRDNVSVELSPEEYPIRYYDEFTLPAGVYNSLRVTIGEGDGKNWWCVLFPSVCVSDAVEVEDKYTEAGFTSDQYHMIKNDSGTKYKVRFKILEILSGFLGFRY